MTDLASVFHSLLVFLLVAGEDLHLDEAADGHERPEAEQQQRQLPRVDEADRQAARHGRHRLQHDAQPHTRHLPNAPHNDIIKDAS